MRKVTRPSKPLDLLGSASRTSSLTNQKTVHATQVNQSQSSATFTTHTSNRKKCLCSCRYGSCWCVTPWHKTDAESPVDIFLSTSQKRSKTHVVTKSLYIKTWFVCSNKFECLKNVETWSTKTCSMMSPSDLLATPVLDAFQNVARHHHWETKPTKLLRSMSNKVPSSEVTKWILRSSSDSFVHFVDEN